MADKREKGMTLREFYSAVLKVVDMLGEEADLPTMNDVSVKDKAEELLAKMDEANAKRKETQSKASKENEPIAEAIIAYLESIGEKQEVASVIAVAVGQSTSKTAAVLRGLVEDGRIKKSEQDRKSKPFVYSKA